MRLFGMHERYVQRKLEILSSVPLAITVISIIARARIENTYPNIAMNNPHKKHDMKKPTPLNASFVEASFNTVKHPTKHAPCAVIK
jgi:hypothetical protein